MIRKSLVSAILMVCVFGCTEVEQSRSPITPASDKIETVLRITPSARDETGRPTVFTAGTRWIKVGEIREGTVMRPVDGGLNVTGIHSREGYAVVSAGSLAGYWLPNEETFSPANGKISLSFETLE